MIALILFLSTTVFAPVYIVALALPFILLRQIFFKNDNALLFTKRETIGYILIGISTCFILFFNLFIGPVQINIQEKSLLGEIPYIILIFVSLFLGRFLIFKDLRIIQVLIIVEIFIGILEYIAGVPTFFRNLTTVTELADSDLLYQKKVFGFSANSSVLAVKIVYLATISIMAIKLYKKINLIDKFILSMVLVGLFITFNRTAILAVFLSSIFFFGNSIKNIFIILFPIILVLMFKWKDIYEQMTRGKNTVDYSGRDEIFGYFINFWSNNIFLGNFGTKVWWNSNGSIWHAHNSYLEFLASNGLIVTIIFFISWILIFGKRLFIVIPILIYSLSQYGFLWGLSFYDIIIVAIIFTYTVERKKNMQQKIGRS